MNNEVLFISNNEPGAEELFSIESLMDSIEQKAPKIISIVDAQSPENSQLYTYNKFLEIFDNSGLDGFIV